MTEYFLPQPDRIAQFMHPAYWDGHHTRDNHTHDDLPHQLNHPELAGAQESLENWLNIDKEHQTIASLKSGSIDPGKLERDTVVLVRQERLQFILGLSGIPSPNDSPTDWQEPLETRPQSLGPDTNYIPGINARYDSVTRLGIIAQTSIYHEPSLFMPNKTPDTIEDGRSNDTPFGVSLTFSHPLRIGTTYHLMAEPGSKESEEVYLRFNHALILRKPSRNAVDAYLLRD